MQMASSTTPTTKFTHVFIASSWGWQYGAPITPWPYWKQTMVKKWSNSNPSIGVVTKSGRKWNSSRFIVLGVRVVFKILSKYCLFFISSPPTYNRGHYKWNVLYLLPNHKKPQGMWRCLYPFDEYNFSFSFRYWPEALWFKQKVSPRIVQLRQY